MYIILFALNRNDRRLPEGAIRDFHSESLFQSVQIGVETAEDLGNVGVLFHFNDFFGHVLPHLHSPSGEMIFISSAMFAMHSAVKYRVMPFSVS